MKLVGQIVLGVTIGILIAYAVISAPQWRSEAATAATQRRALDRIQALHSLSANDVIARCGKPKSDTIANSTRVLAYPGDAVIAGPGDSAVPQLDVAVGFVPPDGKIYFVSYGTYRSTDETMWSTTLPCLGKQ